MSPPRSNSHPTALALPPGQWTPSGASGSSFPVVLIPIVGILATAVLLLGYCAFVTKCCFNWRRGNIVSRRRRRGGRFEVEAAEAVGHGLGESAIQAIPTLRFGRAKLRGGFRECAVCLGEFREGERMRLLPGCFHVFHIDCIDIWLQSHANCPLCRSDLTAAASIATSPFPEQNPNRNSPELRCTPSGVPELMPDQGTVRKTTHVCSKGDECIDRRGNWGEFEVHPMRRSFSMDSSDDRMLCIAVQEILQKKPHLQVMSCGEGSSAVGSGRIRRSFFFGHSRSSKSAVLPI